KMALTVVALWLHAVMSAPASPDVPFLLTPVGVLIATQLFFIVVGVLSPLAHAASPHNKRYREGTTRPPIGTGSWASVRIALLLARPAGRGKTWVALQQGRTHGDLTPDS